MKLRFIFLLLLAISPGRASTFVCGKSESAASRELVANESAVEVKKDALKVLSLLTLRNLWDQIGQQAQMNVLLSNECGPLQLNKIPVFRLKETSEPYVTLKNKNILSELLELCTHDGDQGKLMPYLTAKTMMEAEVILSQLHPGEPSVRSSLCFGRAVKTVDSRSTIASSDLEESRAIADWFSKVKMSSVDKEFQAQGRGVHYDELLSEQDRFAVLEYTCNAYISINGCLRDNDCAPWTKEQITKINRALIELKNASPVKYRPYDLLFRGIRFSNPEVLDRLESAAGSGASIVLDKAYSSATGTARMGKLYSELGGITLIMKTQSCMGISGISFKESEDEFLCPPKMKVLVTKTGMPNTYLLEEAQD